MKLSSECEREADGRWIAEIEQIPGAMAYGATRDEAMAKAEVVALRAIADRIEHGEAKPLDLQITLAAA
jgi:predicted RNase H-like HicB family nuclease